MKTSKYLSMAALALVGAMTMGCGKMDEILPNEENNGKSDVVTLTATVGFQQTKALTSAGVKTFAAGEQIALVYQNTGGTTVKAVSAALTAGNITSDGYTWRTLTSEEWGYLLNTRTTGDPASSVFGKSAARYVSATINTDNDSGGVKGIIVFPDGVNITAAEVTSAYNDDVNGTLVYYYTKCTMAQWAALAAKVCVFLPAAGSRKGASVTMSGGYYWSSSYSYDVKYACDIIFYSESDNGNNKYFPTNQHRHYGRSVRLVRVVR